MSRINRHPHQSNLKNKSNGSNSQGQSNVQLRELAKFLDEKWTISNQSCDGVPYYSEKVPLKKEVTLLNIDRWLEDQRSVRSSNISN